MSLRRKMTSAFCLMTACVATVAAGSDVPPASYSIEFSPASSPAEIFEGKLHLQGTYVTKDAEGTVVDPGFFTAIIEHGSPYEELLNASKWKNKILVLLCGENGSLLAKFKGKTLLSKTNEVEFKKKEGVYKKWKSSKNPTVFVGAEEAEAPVFIFNTEVKSK